MNLILRSAEKLYSKELENQLKYEDSIIFTEKLYGYKLNQYQKDFLKSICNQSSDSSELNVYGDDFKIEIFPQNVQGDCALRIKDFDEEQKLETEIRISFTKDELSQFINMLNVARENMI